MWLQLKNPKLYLMIVCDAAVFTLSLVSAYYLRFEFDPGLRYLAQLKTILPFALFLKLSVFALLGLYRGMWRYTGLQDSWRLAEACLVSSLLLVAVIAYLPFGDRFYGFPRSVFVMDLAFTFLLAGGLRMAIRSYYAGPLTKRDIPGLFLPRFRKARRSWERVLIVGAGSAGEKILREIFDNAELSYEVAGFLDDDPGKRGRAIHGVRVLGSLEDLPAVVRARRIDQVFVAISRLPGARMRRIVDMCKECGVPFKTLPGMGEIMRDKVSVKALRDVNYQDLLRRPPVRLNTDEISDYVRGRRVLVTGCGGSIGSELCRQLVRFEPETLILMDSGEANLYHMQMELLHDIRFSRICCVLGKVQDRPLVNKVFEKNRPELVFHAAAYKHVPLIEKNPWEAVFNNILGTQVVMEAAVQHGLERFVLVSTDKAVRPTNVMGASKRVAELLLQSLQGAKTRLMAVRFGNVVGSSGSVIPLFRRQIEMGGPVTVTHPEITRYFMTIPEAAQLILQAGGMGEGGEIYILEMGIPVRIADMAKDLIRLSGKHPGKDIEIVYTGLREGEKLYEELITQGEGIVGTPHDKIMVLRSNGHWNGQVGQAGLDAPLNRKLSRLYEAAAGHDGCLIRKELHEIVPEYTPQESECVL